ncbi:hypothetical protein [Sphingomonas hankyongi]|uniref:PH domain-containing protein n=1 Tax=Sphingomonas hankyongi TaxID=2908209 RepID=A0ABT0RYI2_9SPHN|nr:hypothetical protein [Sphingomonas hankyongi]MCL6728663.1 hypothetical protein [Sphingomonas hankyongi]
MPGRVSADERARWLAELADALEQAQKLAWQLAQSSGKRNEAMALYGRLEAALQEIEALRNARSTGPRAESGPYWTHRSGGRPKPGD